MRLLLLGDFVDRLHEPLLKGKEGATSSRGLPARFNALKTEDLGDFADF
jgi:hypothetical protein